MKQAEKKLAKLLLKISEVESLVEKSRQSVFLHRDFDACKAFWRLDFRQLNRILPNDLRIFLEQNDVYLTTKETSLLFDSLDRNKDGFVDWNEFLTNVISHECRYYERVNNDCKLPSHIEKCLVEIFMNELEGLRRLEMLKSELWANEDFSPQDTFSKMDMLQKGFLDVRDIYDFLTCHVNSITYKRCERIMRRLDMALQGRVDLSQWEYALRPRDGFLSSRSSYDLTLDSSKIGDHMEPSFQCSPPNTTFVDTTFEDTNKSCYLRSPQQSLDQVDEMDESYAASSVNVRYLQNEENACRTVEEFSTLNNIKQSKEIGVGAAYQLTHQHTFKNGLPVSTAANNTNIFNRPVFVNNGLQERPTQRFICNAEGESMTPEAYYQHNRNRSQSKLPAANMAVPSISEDKVSSVPTPKTPNSKDEAIMNEGVSPRTGSGQFATENLKESIIINQIVDSAQKVYPERDTEEVEALITPTKSKTGKSIKSPTNSAIISSRALLEVANNRLGLTPPTKLIESTGGNGAKEVTAFYDEEGTKKQVRTIYTPQKSTIQIREERQDGGTRIVTTTYTPNRSTTHITQRNEEGEILEEKSYTRGPRGSYKCLRVFSPSKKKKVVQYNMKGPQVKEVKVPGGIVRETIYNRNCFGKKTEVTKHFTPQKDGTVAKVVESRPNGLVEEIVYTNRGGTLASSRVVKSYSPAGVNIIKKVQKQGEEAEQLMYEHVNEKNAAYSLRDSVVKHKEAMNETPVIEVSGSKTQRYQRYSAENRGSEVREFSCERHPTQIESENHRRKTSPKEPRHTIQTIPEVLLSVEEINQTVQTADFNTGSNTMTYQTNDAYIDFDSIQKEGPHPIPELKGTLGVTDIAQSSMGNETQLMYDACDTGRLMLNTKQQGMTMDQSLTCSESNADHQRPYPYGVASRVGLAYSPIKSEIHLQTPQTGRDGLTPEEAKFHGLNYSQQTPHNYHQDSFSQDYIKKGGITRTYSPGQDGFHPHNMMKIETVSPESDFIEENKDRITAPSLNTNGSGEEVLQMTIPRRQPAQRTKKRKKFKKRPMISVTQMTKELYANQPFPESGRGDQGDSRGPSPTQIHQGQYPGHHSNNIQNNSQEVINGVQNHHNAKYPHHGLHSSNSNQGGSPRAPDFQNTSQELSPQQEASVSGSACYHYVPCSQQRHLRNDYQNHPNNIQNTHIIYHNRRGSLKNQRNIRISNNNSQHHNRTTARFVPPEPLPGNHSSTDTRNGAGYSSTEGFECGTDTFFESNSRKDMNPHIFITGELDGSEFNPSSTNHQIMTRTYSPRRENAYDSSAIGLRSLEDPSSKESYLTEQVGVETSAAPTGTLGTMSFKNNQKARTEEEKFVKRTVFSPGGHKKKRVIAKRTPMGDTVVTETFYEKSLTTVENSETVEPVLEHYYSPPIAQNRSHLPAYAAHNNLGGGSSKGGGGGHRRKNSPRRRRTFTTENIGLMKYISPIKKENNENDNTSNKQDDQGVSKRFRKPHSSQGFSEDKARLLMKKNKPKMTVAGQSHSQQIHTVRQKQYQQREGLNPQIEQTQTMSLNASRRPSLSQVTTISSASRMNDTYSTLGAGLGIAEFFKERIRDFRQIEETKLALVERYDFSVRNLFSIMDVSDQGKVHYKDLTFCLKNAGLNIQYADQIPEIFRPLDHDQDGFLDFEQFFELIAPYSTDFRDMLANKENKQFGSLEDFSISTLTLLKDALHIMVLNKKNFQFQADMVKSYAQKNFDILDRKGQGFITLEDIGDLLAESDFQTTRNELRYVLGIFGACRKGGFDFNTFMAVIGMEG